MLHVSVECSTSVRALLHESSKNTFRNCKELGEIGNRSIEKSVSNISVRFWKKSARFGTTHPVVLKQFNGSREKRCKRANVSHTISFSGVGHRKRV